MRRPRYGFFPAGHYNDPRWRGTQAVRERSAKPLCVGSIPTRASILFSACPVDAARPHVLPYGFWGRSQPPGPYPDANASYYLLMFLWSDTLHGKGRSG
jgi:hypothetical protein